MSDSIHENILLSIIVDYNVEYTLTRGHLLGHKHNILTLQ